jgi:hypothetical protein
LTLQLEVQEIYVLLLDPKIHLQKLQNSSTKEGHISTNSHESNFTIRPTQTHLMST